MTPAPGLEYELLESKKKMISGSYLRNAWYVAAWSDDLGDGELLSRTILKETIVLFRKSDGNVAALQDRCRIGSHRCIWERSFMGIASSVLTMGWNSIRRALAS